MNTNTAETTYEKEMREAVEQITKKMEGLDTTTDAVQLFVNHWGRWCAKYKTRKGITFYSFHQTSLGALQSLRDNPQQE
jgi:hypothetical protein